MKTDAQNSVFAEMGRRHGERIAALFSAYQVEGDPCNGEDIRSAVVQHGAPFANELSKIVSEVSEEVSQVDEVEEVERYDGNSPKQPTPDELAKQKADRNFQIAATVGVILVVVLAVLLLIVKTL